MELVRKVTPKKIRLTGSESSVASARSDIEIKINGEDLLNAEVPAGKIWVISVTVGIIETDA